MVHEILTLEIPFLQTDVDPISESGFGSELAQPEVDMAQLYEYCYEYKRVSDQELTEFPTEQRWERLP